MGQGLWGFMGVGAYGGGEHSGGHGTISSAVIRMWARALGVDERKNVDSCGPDEQHPRMCVWRAHKARARSFGGGIPEMPSPRTAADRACCPPGSCNPDPVRRSRDRMRLSRRPHRRRSSTRRAEGGRCARPNPPSPGVELPATVRTSRRPAGELQHHIPQARHQTLGLLIESSCCWPLRLFRALRIARRRRMHRPPKIHGNPAP